LISSYHLAYTQQQQQRRRPQKQQHRPPLPAYGTRCSLPRTPGDQKLLTAVSGSRQLRVVVLILPRDANAKRGIRYARQQTREVTFYHFLVFLCPSAFINDMQHRAFSPR